VLRWLAASLAFALLCPGALGQNEVNPLKPPDRSSPGAALMTFLGSGDAVASYVARDHLPSPSRASFDHLVALSETPYQGLDLSGMSPAERPKAGRRAAMALYETLNRIALPPFDEIPDLVEVKLPAAKGPARWVIPNTEIALVRAESGSRSGEFLFSPETVARAGEFYERVRHLPYVRKVPFENLYDFAVIGGGWMIPYRWIEAMPPLLRVPIAGQAAWKWIGLALLLALLALLLRVVYRVSQLGDAQRPFMHALARLAMPVAVLAAMPVAAYLALVQLNLLDAAASAALLTATAILFLTGAWVAWRLAPVIAEAIIASPRIAPESIDAHLIRVGARVLAIAGAMVLLAMGADRIGVPVYGIVAGLGVGGLAIALAAQPTIENLLGGLSLFADKPVRVGDLCRYGDALGTVEAIGIRSTRIRGNDRTLTTIPNASLAKMPIVNLAQRDRMLIQAVVGLRYETTREQLRDVLVKLREMLLGHPRVSPDPARVRFVGFGDSSLNVEMYAYVMTADWQEFLGIREDILLRVMAIVEQAGASIAFPSRTLYLSRDRGRDEVKVTAASTAGSGVPNPPPGHALPADGPGLA